MAHAPWWHLYSEGKNMKTVIAIIFNIILPKDAE
jgi:hypothetical protein